MTVLLPAWAPGMTCSTRSKRSSQDCRIRRIEASVWGSENMATYPREIMSGGYRKRGEVKRGSGRELSGFAWEGVEASESGLEKEADAIAGAIALFGNIEFAGDAPNVGRDCAGFPVFAGGIIFRFVGG